MDAKLLVAKAFEAQKKAYVPYSGFQVGAALLAKNGEIFTGCNIENAAYTPSNCAERTAVFKAVSEGVTEFEAIAVVGNPKNVKQGEGELCPPCGVCRQVLREFCDPETFQVILATDVDQYEIYVLKDFLPMSFGPGNLG